MCKAVGTPNHSAKGLSSGLSMALLTESANRGIWLICKALFPVAVSVPSPASKM